MKEARDLIKEIKKFDYLCNDWEEGFLKSAEEFLNTRGKLTPPQLKTLQKIYDRVTS